MKLGTKARDKISGYQGVIVGKTFWLGGRVQIGLQAPCLSGGLPPAVPWFDSHEIEVAIKDKKIGYTQK